MGILENLLARVEGVGEGLTGAIVKTVVERHEDDILERQRVQLLEGKTAEGKDIRPYYSEDLKPGGWFKSRESAQRYAQWKRSLSYPVQAERNEDAPNLFITGKFHDELGVEFGSDAVTIKGESAYAAAIVSKYGLAQFGLSGERWSDIFQNCGGLDELMTEIRKRLWQ